MVTTQLPTKENRYGQTLYPVFGMQRADWKLGAKPDGYRRCSGGAAAVIRDAMGDPDIDATCVEWDSELGAYFAAG
jgi:hypothetical protein